MKTTKAKSKGRRKVRAPVSAGSKILAAIDEATEVLRSEGLASKQLTLRTYKAASAPHPYQPGDVKRVRELLGASQAVLARLLGVNVNTVWSWEQGKRPPQPIACRFLAEIEARPGYWRRRKGSMDHPVATRPTDAERCLAREASRRLADRTVETARLELSQANGPEEAVEIPAAALPLLRQVLDAIAEGHPVAVVDDAAELSTEQAAELLGVSGCFLVGLLERGAIPFRQVGDQRWVRFQDLMDYRRRDEAQRLKALEELAVQAQELNMGY